MKKETTTNILQQSDFQHLKVKYAGEFNFNRVGVKTGHKTNIAIVKVLERMSECIELHCFVCIALYKNSINPGIVIDFSQAYYKL